jgi:hypothetical protein
MFEDYPTIEHLNLAETEHVIATNKPRLAILTHFGMGMVKAKPWEIAEQLTKKLGVHVIAAHDGMEINLEEEKK